MSAVSVRYIVNDVGAAVAFYTQHLGFGVEMHPGPGFAVLSRGELRLLLNTPGGGGGAGQSSPMGDDPSQGAGIVSSLRSRTWPHWSISSHATGRTSATRS